MFVFTCGNRGFLVYQLNEKKEAKFFKKLADECKLFKCSPDGKLVAYVNRDGVHLIDAKTLAAKRTLCIPKVYDIEFSPLSTFISVCGHFFCKPGEQPTPNLHIVSCESGETVHSYVQKKQSSWEPLWFADESYLARVFNNTVKLYEPGDFDKFTKQINIERVSVVCLSPCVKRKYFACYVPTNSKGQPAFCRLFNIEQPGTAIASKSFFKCDSVQFKWNPRGMNLLIMATNEVDKTNASYYGDQAMHYATVDGESCMVQLKKNGPIYSNEWCTDTSFCVIYGFMPSKATLFNLKCDPIWELEESHRNCLYLNPHRNILLTAGFGNLQGIVEVWDLEQKKRMTMLRMPDTTHLEFSADGEHFLTATHAPRLKVNNGFKVWHYSGALRTQVLADKENPESFGELWYSALPREPLGKYPKPEIKLKRVEGIAQIQPTASKQAYVPPGMRAAMESAKKAEPKKQKKKAKAEKVEAPPEPKIDPNVAKADEDERKARAIKKKLSQIFVLKQRLEAGEELEPEQLEKISREKDLADELKQLDL